MRLLRMTLVGLALAALFGSPTGVRAHANLVGSLPAANSVVADAPAQATLWFDDALEVGLNSVTVLNGEGAAVSSSAAQLSSDRLTLTVPLQTALPDGTYTVAYRTVSTSDGHNVRGFYIFSVGAPGSAAQHREAVPRVDWSLLPAPLSAVIAWASATAALTLAGGLFVLGLLSGGTATASPRLRRALAGSALALLAAQVAALAVYTADVRELPLASFEVLAQLPATLTGSRYGAIWLVRAALTLALLAAVLRGFAAQRAGYRLALLALSAVVLLSFSAQSHSAAAAQSLGSPWPLLVDWLHLAAAAVWFGGVIFLVAAGPGQPWLAAAARPFGVWVLLAVGVLAVTGSYQTGVQAPQPAVLHDTAYGWVLTAKQLLIALALVAGVAARQTLARADAPGTATVLLRAEAGLAAAALLAAALLAQTGPPHEAAAAAEQRATALGERPAGDLLTSVAFRPRPQGDWEIDVQLRDSQKNPLPNAARVTVGGGVLGSDIGWSTVTLTPQGYGRYSAPVQWLHADGRWGVFVTVRRRGVADDVTALYGVQVAGRQLTALQYSTGAQPLYVGTVKNEDYWGLIEFVETAEARQTGGDAYITLTDPSGAYLDWVQQVRVSAAPNIGPGGAVGDGPGYQDAAELGPGRYLLRNMTMSVLGDWTVRVQLAGRGQDAAEGFFTFLVAPDGVRSLGGDFPPGHH